jgi:hypothetical protein
VGRAKSVPISVHHIPVPQPMSSILRGFVRGARYSFPRIRALMIMCWRFSRSHSSCCAVISLCRTRGRLALLVHHRLAACSLFQALVSNCSFGSYSILLTARMISEVRPSILEDKIEQAIAQADGAKGGVLSVATRINGMRWESCTQNFRMRDESRT